MQGTPSIIRTPKAQRVRNDQFDVKQERRANERNRQAARSNDRSRKYNPE